MASAGLSFAPPSVNNSASDPLAFSTAQRCAASPTGWVEIADDFLQDDMSFIGRMTVADLLCNPYVRPLSRADAMQAELAELKE